MFPPLPESRVSPAVVKVLRATEIPPRQRAQGHLKPSKGPTGLHILSPTAASMDRLGEALARTEASPVVSCEAIPAAFIRKSIGEPVRPSSLNPSDEPIVYGSGYVTFPKYRKTTCSKADDAQKVAKKVKKCLISAGIKLLTSFQAAGDFYAYSERKWESEYQPFECVTPSNNSVLEAIEAADKRTQLKKARNSSKHHQTSWGKKLQNYWKPEPAPQPSTTSVLTINKGDAPLPPISTSLKKQNGQRPERMQPSHQPTHPLRRGRTLSRSERIQLMRKQQFSPPEGGMSRLESQPRRAYRAYQLQTQQRGVEANGGGKEAWEDVEEGDEEGGFGTPWSGLETVDEERVLGEQIWGGGEVVRDDEGTGGGEIGDSRRVKDDGLECDELEASGELCLRHNSCYRQAMALSGE